MTKEIGDSVDTLQRRDKRRSCEPFRRTMSQIPDGPELNSQELERRLASWLNLVVQCEKECSADRDKCGSAWTERRAAGNEVLAVLWMALGASNDSSSCEH